MKLKKPNKSPLKLDPTRTVTLRRMFEQAFNKRFTELKKRITKLVVTDDCFGLNDSNHDPFTTNANDSPNPYNLQHQIVTHIREVLAQTPGQTIASFKDVRMTLTMLDKSEFDYHVLSMRSLGLLKLYVEPESVNLDHASLDWMVRERNLDSPEAYGGWIYYNGVSIVPTTNTAFKFHSMTEQIKAFQSWLKQQVSILLLTEGDTSWWRKYIVDGFKKGQGRVFDDFNDKAADITDTQRQFLKGAFNNPVSEERVDVLASRVFTELKGVTDAMAQQISRELTDGLTQGLNPVDIAKNLNAKVDGIGKNRARMIAQTECLPAETIVDAAVISAVFRRWYDGDLVEIETRTGRKFSATPNHPMLTRRGWVPAGELQQGDNLVCDNRQKSSVVGGDGNVYSQPISIGEIFESFNMVLATETVIGSKNDFHGDGGESEVQILRSDRELLFGSFSPLYQPVAENVLTESGFANSTFCEFCSRLLSVNQQPCLCRSSQVNTSTFQSVLDSVSVSTQTFGDLDQGLSVLISRNDTSDVQVVPELVTNSTVLPSEQLGSRDCTVDSSFSTDATDPTFIPPFLSSDLLVSQSAEIEFDDVTLVTFRQFSGHVFNLETRDGYYSIAEGCYTGNTIRAHAEGQLDELERMGVKHVGVQVEFSSAHDHRTCPICRKLDNKKYTLEKARGIIPVHVCCRCCFRPVLPTDLLEGTKDDETPEEETTETEEAVQPKPSLWSKVKGWFIGNVEYPTTWTAEEIEDNFTGAEE